MSEPASHDKELPDAPTSIDNRDESPAPTRSELLPAAEINSESQHFLNSMNGRVDSEPESPMVATLESTPKANGLDVETRSSERCNGSHGNDDERPSKRQRTQDATPSRTPRKPKPISPPWKRFEAEGPTSYHENGRRKSGRVNSLPMEHQPPGKRRVTRGAVNPSPSSKTQSTQNSRAEQVAARTQSSSQKSASAARGSRARAASGSFPRNGTKKPAPEAKSSARSTRRRSPSPPPPRQNTRPFRSTRDTTSREIGQSPRIRLRVNRSGVIPLVHPDQVRKRPQVGSSFEDFWKRAGDIPVEQGGLMASEDGPVYTDELARKDAHIILRIENEAKPGGLLSLERCTLYVPQSEQEPARQYARQDHMAKAALGFRKLMVMEHQRHRQTAKRLAEACRDEWLRRQPKSVEQLEAEARDYWVTRYRLVIKALSGTWENVRLEVNRRRLEEWEAEEQRRVKAALNEAVNLSELKLQARQGGPDSEMQSDEDGFSDLSDDMSESDDEVRVTSRFDRDQESSDANSDNMSSSDEEDAEEIHDPADESLTQEQLRAKYAHIPDVGNVPGPSPAVYGVEKTAETKSATQETSETSDESIDMEDDMSSSADESEDQDEGQDGDDEEDEGQDGSGDEAAGLLGLFFGKSELKKMNDEAGYAEATQAEDTTMTEEQPRANDDADTSATPDEALDGFTSDLAQPGQVEGDVNMVLEQAVPEAHCSAAKATRLLTGPAALEGPGPPASSGFDDMAKPPEKRQHSLRSEETPLSSDSQISAPDDERQMATGNPNSKEASQAIETTSTKMASTGKQNSETDSPASPARKIDVPFLLRGTLRGYQHDGLEWLAGLYANETNGILADEMGLGKTIQTIALLAHLACKEKNPVWGPHLVVVPTSVMLNWEMEFKKWCPGFKILAYYGSQEERKRKRQGWNNDDVWNVCITSYQLVLQDQQVFKRRRWHYLILDEAHNIKNFKSQRWQTLLGFNTQARLLLTGTPLQNNLTELWSLLFFLMPAKGGVGGFADLKEFHDWFSKPESQILENGREQMDDEARAIISKLHKVLRPYLLRRLKSDVEKQMPGKYEHVEFCRLSKRQRELYDGFLARADTRNTLASGNYMSIINCLMQLRKVCNHPDLFVDRQITTSFRMQKSVLAEYDHIESRVQRRLLSNTPMDQVSLGFLNLVPTQHEHLTTTGMQRVLQLSSNRTLGDLKEAQRVRAQNASTILNPATIESNIAYLEGAGRWSRFEELQHCVYLNALRRQQRPIYGQNLINLLTIGAGERPFKSKPKVPQKIMEWFEEDSHSLHATIKTVNQRAQSLKTIIEKFSFVTPAVVTRDLDRFVLGQTGTQAFTEEDLRLSKPVSWIPWMPRERPEDPWHEARMRLSIQFPDKRLLQYDCGKLQVLDGLLRRLQAGGHRALIFTQMTKVLDILEQFLNIHGHKYLRLDGATKVEQRQILTDRFNNDPRILCFILSTRSGGLGINLTGADTVIFYDQDWNPAMDKQCQDRCHRIGQTRDVHIYRLVSEHTIEANILRKASQKQMLDDVVIQEGEFTTDTFNKVSVRDVLQDKVDFSSEGVSAADAALDRVLGGGSDDNGSQRTVGRVLEQAEDREDVTAARAAEKEIQADDADFTDKPSNPASGTSTARQGTPAMKSALESGVLDDSMALSAGIDEVIDYNAWGDRMRTVDDFMLGVMSEFLKGTRLELPKDKKKGKKRGKDTRKR